MVTAGAGDSPGSFRDGRDVFVQLLDGGVALHGEDGASEEFSAGDCFVVLGDASERWHSPDGFTALVVQAGAPADFRDASERRSVR